MEQTSQNFPESNKKISAKLIWLIVSVLVLAGGVYGAMWWRQQESSTEMDTWKTYTNTQYEFEFKYPTEFKLDTTNQEPSSVVNLLDLTIEGPVNKPDPNPNSYGPSNHSNIHMYVANNLTDEIKSKTNLEMRQNNKSDPPGWSYSFFSGYGFLGVAGKYLGPYGEYGESIDAYKILPSGLVLGLRWDLVNSYGGNELGYEKLLLPILSTFKFIDGDVSGWNYKNDQYGFAINLPDSWNGYTVLTSEWEGREIATGNVTQRGPLITIRHPLWTTAKPREDMPVMVFTPEQWGLVKDEKLSLGAAPIEPSLLGHNSKYIIGLPARYNYDFKTGWEEVDQLVHTLKTYEPK